MGVKRNLEGPRGAHRLWVCAQAVSCGKIVAPSQTQSGLEMLKDLKKATVKWTETGREVVRYQTTHTGSLRKGMGLK